MAYGGSGLVNPSDLDLSLPPADKAAARSVIRSAVLAPLLLVVLFLFDVSWLIVALVALILILPLAINRIRVLRDR